MTDPERDKILKHLMMCAIILTLVAHIIKTSLALQEAQSDIQQKANEHVSHSDNR